MMKKSEESNFYLNKRGYVVKKKILKQSEILQIRSELTVKPNVFGDYAKEEEPFKIFLENDNKLYLPKFYGIEKFGKDYQNEIPEGKDIDINFALSLKDEQKIPAEITLKAYKENGGGILSLPCGFGKTILGLYFISKLKKKTIIIVHKEFLMNQWVERINFALPDAKVGVIQGDKFEMDGNDIVIGMLQTISMRDYPIHAFDDIGHVIIDECHRIPSKVFSRALLKINSTYMLGLSATPNRKDGLTKVLKWYIGDIIYSVKSSEKNIVFVKRYILDSKNEDYNKEINNFRGQAQMPTMLNNISNYYPRTKLIMDVVLKEISENNIRQILILSDRKQQLEDMYKIAMNNNMTSVGYYVGGMKKEKLKENESCKLLLGTFPMANEGLDIPSLNGLVLATPKSDIIQSIGRICRVKHNNIQPLIIDIIDNFSIFERQGAKRLSVYKKNRYQVSDINFDLDKSKQMMIKDYFFHNMKKEDSESDCSIDTDVDTEYDNIDMMTNKKIKNVSNSDSKLLKETKEKAKTVKSTKNSDKDTIDNLFKKMSMFS